MRCRRPLILIAIVVVTTFSLLAAGCGGDGSSGVANIASSTTVATTITTNGTTTTQTGTLASALAFARCMRSHGIPDWPDPDSRGFFDKTKLQPLGLSVSRVRSLEEGACNIPLPSGGQPSAQTITPAEQADYRAGAACMRSHGFPDFPDPTFENQSVTFNLPSSLDTNSVQFTNARTACERLIPAGLPYSSSSAR